MDTVKSLVGEYPVVIFGDSSCCICHSIKELIRGFGANPIVYELDHHPDGDEIERKLGGNQCLPVVYIGQKLVGGAKQVTSLHVRGELVQELIRGGAIWV
ncbi:monothiol glutaredoxin-S1-like [Cornus florida]|uniref:monothiol glutaredoxin-S1-like n=1 Tax=Cornus florida TaxID=4283 RepID=UPI00289AB50D|nr:monothiol glutaredoxin-S1-like [Cornus florida]